MQITRSFLLSIVVVLFSFLFSPAALLQAQDREKDREMADYIKRVTNRTSEGLREEYTKNGIFVNLQGRFQNVLLARIDEKSYLRTACVTDFNEANLTQVASF